MGVIVFPFAGVSHAGSKLQQSGALLFTDRKILLGAGLVDGKPGYYFNNAGDQPQCQLTVIPRVDRRGYTLNAAIPFDALGIAPKEGTSFRFDLGINDSEDGTRRLRQLMWNGTSHNSTDRTAWGRAVLGK